MSVFDTAQQTYKKMSVSDTAQTDAIHKPSRAVTIKPYRYCKKCNICYNILMKSQNNKFEKIIDDTFKIPNKIGNGILKISMSVDENEKLARYSLSYINYRLCSVDNGRVLGYDNSHGYHHRHFMGIEEPIKFESYEAIAERFDKEWRELHEKAKKHHN